MRRGMLGDVLAQVLGELLVGVDARRSGLHEAVPHPGKCRQGAVTIHHHHIGHIGSSRTVVGLVEPDLADGSLDLTVQRPVEKGGVPAALGKDLVVTDLRQAVVAILVRSLKPSVWITTRRSLSSKWATM